MKNRILPILLLIPYFAFAQTAEERVKIASYSNKEGNARLAVELKQDEEQRQNRLAAYFSAHPEAKKIIKKDETGTVEIMDVLPNGELVLAKTHNDGAAITARAKDLYSGGALGINIQGQGMTAGVWDEGRVRATHQELMVSGASKVTVLDPAGAISDHATHVAGTIAAQGISASARGLAFNSSVISRNWTNDLTEMQLAVSNGLLASNHSYGMGILGSQWFYGAYDSRALQIDDLCYNNPYYLPVFSAGNDRNETTPPASTQIAAKQGYDMIFGHGNAKNIITVAAINQMNTYVGLASPQMSPFSSYGPSDDGRIKPEISMKGVGVVSLGISSDVAYATMSGTSMASPGITGVILLLQQYYNQLYSNYMRAATVKGLMLHTADDAGLTLGPDARFGWGVVNASTSAKTIRDKNLTVGGTVIEENILANTSTFTKTFSAAGPGQLRVSISWTDPAPAAANSGVNDPGVTDPNYSNLVNDLDIKVTNVAGTVFYPWKLQGMATPNAAATNNSPNNKDNFERVDINNPSGQYTITVTHKGTLAAPQNFSLIITGDNLSTLGVKDVKLASVKVFPNPSTDFINIEGVEKFSLNIIDGSGKIVLSEKNSPKKVNVSSLTSGLYYLVIKNLAGEDQTVKFIKK